MTKVIVPLLEDHLDAKSSNIWRLASHYAWRPKG